MEPVWKNLTLLPVFCWSSCCLLTNSCMNVCLVLQGWAEEKHGKLPVPGWLRLPLHHLHSWKCRWGSDIRRHCRGICAAAGSSRLQTCLHCSRWVTPTKVQLCRCMYERAFVSLTNQWLHSEVKRKWDETCVCNIFQSSGEKNCKRLV